MKINKEYYLSGVFFKLKIRWKYFFYMILVKLFVVKLRVVMLEWLRIRILGFDKLVLNVGSVFYVWYICNY